ncbi:MAG: hypothetical protein JO232_20890, partial [Verrucomicrobia bacterium]|nr:hypothetical protein [Verrucomicrobiota bacterium]
KFFDKDRKVKHPLAITIQDALDFGSSIRLLTIPVQLLLDSLASCRAIAGLDAVKDLSLRERHGLGDFTQQMEVVGHQNIVQDLNTAKNRYPTHEAYKTIRFLRTVTGGAENKEGMDSPRDAVVKAATVRFDAW